MPVELSVAHTLDRAVAALSDLERRQVPFATARALTSVAYAARDEVRKELPGRFTLRRPWVARGIAVEPAKKSKPAARVFSRDAFMVAQETGGPKPDARPIPVGRIAAVHKTRVVPLSQWVAPLLRRKNVFYRAGSVFERKGDRIAAVYLLRRQVSVAPRFGFAATVERVVADRFASSFAIALGRAMATAR
ncbi:hypothetical protein BAL199_08228 [alpha proteobacterium BAL199]|nr:hypothetical protein BAL199_08228 [alpha proteobacterium BAL199]